MDYVFIGTLSLKESEKAGLTVKYFPLLKSTSSWCLNSDCLKKKLSAPDLYTDAPVTMGLRPDKPIVSREHPKSKYVYYT